MKTADENCVDDRCEFCGEFEGECICDEAGTDIEQALAHEEAFHERLAVVASVADMIDGSAMAHWQELRTIARHAGTPGMRRWVMAFQGVPLIEALSL